MRGISKQENSFSLLIDEERVVHVSVVGTGLLGSAMALRLLTLGHEVVVWNRTFEKTEFLRQQGATVARSAAEAVQASESTILMLSDARAIQEVLWDQRSPANFQRRTIVQMGTIAPEESRALGKEVRARLGDYLEAPVLGSLAEAKNGTLIVMVGGTPELMERWGAVFQCFCQAPIFVGPIGRASALKLALNQLIASHIAAFSLSLGMVQRSGGDVGTFMQVLRQSALMTPMFDKKLPKMLAHDYSNPNFSTEHLLKDITLCLQTAQTSHLETTALEGLQTIFQQALSQSLPSQDYSSVFDSIVPRET